MVTSAYNATSLYLIIVVMNLDMFIKCDITTAISSSYNKNEQMRLQALLFVKNNVSRTKVAEDFPVHHSTVNRWMKRIEIYT